MSLSRTCTRVATVAAASLALALGSAGVASAASVSHDIDGNTVSATFTVGITDLPAPVDGCVAVVSERGQAQGIADRIKNINLDNIVGTLRGEGSTVLRTENGSPVALPALTRPVTVSADNIPSGVYSLITHCATDTVPVIRTIAVGDATNTMGSVVTQGPALLSSGLNMF